MFDSSIIENIDAFVAFIEGLVSFFSPCVIPLLPIYLGYLSGGMEDKSLSRKKTLLFTITFIIGIFTALLLLNASISWISVFFQDASVWIMRIGGILIIILGLIQLGLFRIPLLERTFHIHYDFSGRHMSMVLAFVMGFTFSFSWTPCIGPALASILIMASSSGSFLMSTFLVVCYAVGFALPFLVISFFSKQAVSFFHKHDTAMQVIVKVGAIILIFMGILMAAGGLSVLGGATDASAKDQASSNQQDNSQEQISAPQFELTDQHGNQVKLSDYEGKIVYMNFWGTWCGVCRSELSDIQKLYDTYQNSDEVAVITLVYPKGGRETDIEGIKAFIEENDIAFPVLFDTEGSVFTQFGINSFPTVFMLNPDQSVYGYLSGGLSYDMMENIIQQTREGKKQ